MKGGVSRNPEPGPRPPLPRHQAAAGGTKQWRHDEAAVLYRRYLAAGAVLRGRNLLPREGEQIRISQARIQEFTQGDARFCKGKIIQKKEIGRLSIKTTFLK